MKEIKLAYIYKITNIKNNLVYIGQTTLAVEERFKHHIRKSRSNYIGTRDYPLYQDMRKLGVENYAIEQIDYCLEKNKFILEKHWINLYADKGIPLYNIVGTDRNISRAQKIANRRLTNSHSYESKEYIQKMSEATAGENNPMYGKRGSLAVNGQPVYAFDNTGKVQHEFVSVREALKFLKLKGHAGLMKACKTGEIYKGYYWKKEWKSYAKDEL